MKIGEILPKNLTPKEKKEIVEIFAKIFKRQIVLKQLRESAKNLVKYSTFSWGARDDKRNRQSSKSFIWH